MIIVDYRKGGEKDNKDTPQQLVSLLQKLGLKAEKGDLEFGDVAFEGRGPDGTIAVGIERKTLHDMLNCIDDARFAGHQRVGMKQMYQVCVLMLEGHWKPHDPEGILMEGFNGGYSWGYCRYRSQRTMYAKLYRYLISISLSGVIVGFSRDLAHTAVNIHEWYHYFQKLWGDHTSMRETRKLQVPSLKLRPPLVRLWAADLDGVGVKLGEQAAKQFKTPIALAQADESDWLRIPGIGVKSAQQIVREIWGMK